MYCDRRVHIRLSARIFQKPKVQTCDIFSTRGLFRVSDVNSVYFRFCG